MYQNDVIITDCAHFFEALNDKNRAKFKLPTLTWPISFLNNASGTFTFYAEKAPLGLWLGLFIDIFSTLPLRKANEVTLTRFED